MNKELIETHGKCILLGEHSVVRGGEAIVFPLKCRSLRLSFETIPEGWKMKESSLAAPFREVLALATKITESKLPPLSLSIESNIPERAGLGSSAALAVAVVRFLEKTGTPIGNSFSLALELENIFHGKSSGIDIAAVLAGSPISFQKGKAEPLKLNWKPKLFLSDSGLRSSTKECVQKVDALSRPDIDQKMIQAVKMAKASLASQEGEKELAESIELGAKCFEEWGLIPKEMHQKAEMLRDKGALAVKPTGSGLGGFLLSLWSSLPPEELDLLPVESIF